MFISVLSKHLPSVIKIPDFQEEGGRRVLELVHSVESARYHAYNFELLVLGEGKAPSFVRSWVDFGGEELDFHWRVMVAWMELESFLVSGKQILDRTWSCLGKKLDNGAEKIDTLGAALDLTKLRKNILDESTYRSTINNPCFQKLKNIWQVWGSELSKARNYVEHFAPFGGRSFGAGIKTHDEKIRLHLLLPDNLKDIKVKKTPKEKFTYHEQRLAITYVQERMIDIDKLFAEFLPLLYS